MKRWVFILAVVLILTGSSAQAQTDKDGPMAKLHQSLVALHEQYTTHLAQSTRAAFSSADPLVRLIGDRVVVDVVASGDVEVLKSDLVSLGMQNAVSFGRIVSGELPVSKLPSAAVLPSLRFAQSSVVITNVGLVSSQGDQAMRSNVARSKFGVNGAGVKVGVLSNSFNCLGGAAADVANGDLSPVTVIQEISSCTGATDEGRAMLQIVHDVAPGAALLFATDQGGQANFATNILALAAAGAKVIVDDAFSPFEPFFQDGIIAQAVDSVVASGVAYFASAGNDGRLAYDHAFVPGQFFSAGSFGNAAFLGGTAHNFNQGGTEDNFQRITIGAHTSALITFQWDSPFFSVGGVGTQNDVDIYLLNATNTQVIGASTTNNIVSGDAVEVGSLFNNGATPADLNIMIVNRTGPNPGRIKYKIFQSPNFTIQEYATNSGTISGHQNAKGTEAVGAAAYFNTPVFGVSPPVLEFFSSSGTTPILFDLAGNRLATPDPRADKPELVAPDGVTTTVPGFSNFFGTSAAAPHAAGVAALLLDLKPFLTPAQIYKTLENTAINIGPPGFDNNSGFGLIQADSVLAAAPNKASVDFDGDGKSDIAIYRSGVWFILRSSDGGVTAMNWGGLSQDIPVPGDYDGDGKMDIAVYRSGVWFIVRSSDGVATATVWGGLPQDVLVPGDYDGDGKMDIAVYRSGVWFIVRSSDGVATATAWGGLVQDIPVPADYDGDGKMDIAVYRDGVWFIRRSSDGVQTAVGWGGLVQDVPVPADYDGDGKVDVAVYRNGLWFIRRSSDGVQTAVGWGGLPQDIPVPADYDGDGKTDIAVYRDGIWFIRRSSDGVQTAVGWGGLPQDIPLN